MKKSVLLFLCLVLLQFQNVFAISHVTTDSISYLKIAELEYKDGQLFLIEHVKPVDSKDYEEYRLPLSGRERVQFLRLVEELKLLDIQSNDSKSKNKHELPLEVQFVKHGKPKEISAHRNGMSKAEKVNFDSYLKQTPKIIHRRNHIKALLASSPDGEYRVKDWKSGTLHRSPKGWKLWEKRGTMIITEEPVYVLNGKVIDPEKKGFKHLSPEDIESIEVLKDALKEAKMIEVYGEQAKHGVVIIETKKKKRFRLFRPKHSSKTP